MKKYEHVTGATRIGEGSFVCSEDEFEIETDKPDGSMLEVVNENTHRVTSYHIAYRGYWNKR